MLMLPDPYYILLPKPSNVVEAMERFYNGQTNSWGYQKDLGLLLGPKAPRIELLGDAAFAFH